MYNDNNGKNGNRLLDQLTSREMEVLRLVAQGMTNREIAAELFLSYYTVRTHVSTILGKMGVSNRTHAVLLALDTGMVQPHIKLSPVAQTIILLLRVEPSALRELKALGVF